MTPMVRTLLVWLLVLAVPAQGAAAATMALCGPGHHDASAAAQVVVAADAVHGVAPAGPQGHAPGAGRAANAHDDAAGSSGQFQAVGDASAADAGQHDKAMSCSVCAACCSMAVMASAWPPLPVADFAATVFPTLDCCVDAFASAGPERPPRIDFA